VKYSRARLLAGAAFLVLATGFVPAAVQGGPISGPIGSLAGGLIGVEQAQAQNIGQRVVLGKVNDSGSTAVAGATVFLKDLKTKSIRSYTTTDDGKFRFTQVNMAEDYDLWAEKADRKSATKSVSSWDSRKEFECELKLK